MNEIQIHAARYDDPAVQKPATGYHRIEDFGYYAGSAGVLSFARNL